MAVAPLESSSTPPDTTSTDTTRSPGDSMEEIDPQSTRKRPRLDSGSGVCESLSLVNEIVTVPESTPDAPAITDEEAPVLKRSASRMTINMKSPATPPTPNTPDNPTPDSEQSLVEEMDPVASAQPISEQPTNFVSLSSSPAQSPEIEVAELEDMDQDPNTTSWKPLGEALRDPSVPDVVQLRTPEPVDLPGIFPWLSVEQEPRENLAEICMAIEKESHVDTMIFSAVKQWFDEVVNALEQLTSDVFMESRQFWDEVPIVLENLLRRADAFHYDDAAEFWTTLEELCLNYIRLSLHLMHMDTLVLRQSANESDLSGLDIMSRHYIQAFRWSLSLERTPIFRTMRTRYRTGASNTIARLIDQMTITSLNGPQYLLEYASCLTAIIPRCSQLSQTLIGVLDIARYLVESGNDRNDPVFDSPLYQQGMETLYNLVRAVDEQYQADIVKKSPWVTIDTSPLVLGDISAIYIALCHCGDEFALRIAEDLSITAPRNIELKDLASIVYYGWRFSVLKKHIIDGRMELRVSGIEAMQTDFVQVFTVHMQSDPVAGIAHPLVQYLVRVLRESKIIDYLVGVDSHPQLISRSYNVLGFLVITEAYTDSDTDTIWKTVTDSPDPRTISEVLGMVQKTLNIRLRDPSRLHSYCSKMLELPLVRFDSRMVEFCHQVFVNLFESYNDREDRLSTFYIDIRPLRLCVRLIRESAASEDLAADHKAHLQKFAATKLACLMDIGISDVDKMDIYERCVQDIAERNQFSVGSIQALNALLSRDSREIRKLTTEFNLTQLLILDLAEVVDGSQPDAPDTFSWNGFLPRVQMISRIIDEAPDSITPELGDILWQRVFMSRLLPQHGRRALWETLCNITVNSGKENAFIDQCIQHYLPRLSPPTDYFPEVLAFAKTTLNYQMRFCPPPAANENEVVTIPGMDRIWSFILTAPPNSIENEAIAFAIEVYLDHHIIRRSPRSSVEATHMSLVDRCVDQLKSAAHNLKLHLNKLNADEGPMALEAHTEEIVADELEFSRSLFFLRQFLQALRARPQYSPPQHSPPSLPINPLKGDIVDIRYQAFDGGSSSKVRSLQIGDLSTASELVEALTKVTDFPKLMTIFGGQRADLLDKPDQTVRDLRLGSGLLIVRRDPSCRGTPGRRAPPLTSVDTEVLKHFDDLYDLLNLDEKLAREIFEFLVLFPPQEKVINLVKSTNEPAETMLPMSKPYNLLYSLNALTDCLRAEALEPSPSEPFISHSIEVVVATLTRPEIMGSSALSRTHVQLAINLAECLYNALLVKPAVAGDVLQIPDSGALVEQLLRLMAAGQNAFPSHAVELDRFKLIWYTFGILIEGSVRDSSFWTTIKQQVQFEQLILSLLIEEQRHNVRKGVADHIGLVCSPSKQLKKAKLPASEMQEARSTAISENPSRIDILGTIWDAFVLTFPRVLDFSNQSQEFFEIAHSVFSSVAEKSPRDLVFSDYLKQWSDIMLSHKTKEFVGREPVDHLIFGFSRLLRSCLEIANSSDIKIDTFNLVEQILDNYLFPDLSPDPSSPSQLLIPQIPVMHTQTRQELYSLVLQLSHDDDNYTYLIERLKDIIPEDHTCQFGWNIDRQRLIRSPEGYAGLKNLSNTCYLNSLLSQLFMNVEFREFMLGLNLTDGYATQRLLDETKKVFAYMQESWLKSVDPEEFVDSIRTYDNEPVDVTIQMDVDEFYNLLFDRWEAQISSPEDRKRFRSFYGGQLVQQIKSKECPHISERLEPFSAIQCEIKGKASLEESLQAYVEGEIMQGDNKYSCTSCGRHVDAVKRACLKDVPDNLIFHLKRFDFDMVTMMRSKINDEFQFPERINMTPFTVEYLSESNQDIKEDIFELVGVLVHSGTAESGHYYSYVRERPTAGGSGGTWVEFNDADVSRFDPRRIGDQCFGGLSESLHSASGGHVRYNKAWNAYMLLYQRISSMDAARSVYVPESNQYPIRVPLPVSLANHIVMENELFVRTYCLLDNSYAVFVRYLFKKLNETKLANSAKGDKLDQSMIFIALDTFEQLVSRTKDSPSVELIVAELYRAINEFSTGPLRFIQWARKRPAGVARLLKSGNPSVRDSSVRLFVNALSKLRERHITAEDATEKLEREYDYLEGLEHIVAGLDAMWPSLHSLARSWEDYFEFLLCIGSFGQEEIGILLNHGFLVKCLEIVWLDHEDAKRLKRQYAAYYRLIEKGRKFSHQKLMDVMSALLANIDLTVRPISDDEREALLNGKFSLTATENSFIRPLGSKYELTFLKKILQQHSNPRACMRIVSLFMEAEPEAGLMDSIIQVLEEGLRVDPADRCTPFLEASLVVCRTCPDEERIVGIIDYVAKGVDTINTSGGKEHLAFFTNLLTSHNQRLGLDEKWFLSRVMDMVPDWAPWLLLYPDRAVRALTVDTLRRLLFNEETTGLDEDWQARHAGIAKDLVLACVGKLRVLYTSGRGNASQGRVLDPIRTVIEHCLGTYFNGDEKDENVVHQAQTVLAAIEEMPVELPEELPSESDKASSEEWEDNSMIASDSEMGMAGTP
ncbi:hypothetical protein BJX68DRAFT_244747 [Aspergillus pseudodeflectus]|uniref:USP domain-containing protein n=1 Tax=Aspergillus pseudodeflectus TaxID=176178 RepID=A0ABR4JR23_9EURO